MSYRGLLGWLLGVAIYSASAVAAPFEIQVVDPATGRGVPLVELAPQNGQTVVTDSNGIVAFDQAARISRSLQSMV